MTVGKGAIGACSRELLIVIGPDQAEQRTDRAIANCRPELSRRMVQTLCESGRVLLRGRPLRKSDPLNAGDCVTVLLDVPREASPDPDTPLTIRFESSDWVVLAKPPGQPTAPRDADERGTLANALLARFPDLKHIGHRPLEPGLLHRLDNGTSGLLVAARTPEAFSSASSALARGEWTKRYLALVHATDLPESGVIRGHLVSSRRNPRRVELEAAASIAVHDLERCPSEWATVERASHCGTKAHETHFSVKLRLGPITYVEIAVSAAFRHQIRAHFSLAGWPLVNDEIYGAVADPRLAPGRHALHAARVAWAGTAGLAGFDVFEPLPADLARCVELTPEPK